MKIGCIYCVTSKVLSINVCKIGYATCSINHIHKYLKTRYGTAYGQDIHVVCAKKVGNPRMAEQYVHKALKQYKVSGEMFQVSNDIVKNIFDMCPLYGLDDIQERMMIHREWLWNYTHFLLERKENRWVFKTDDDSNVAKVRKTNGWYMERDADIFPCLLKKIAQDALNTLSTFNSSSISIQELEGFVQYLQDLEDESNQKESNIATELLRAQIIHTSNIYGDPEHN